MSDGRFTLAVGAGERLNEHVTGAAWPAVDVRHDQLAEAIGIMRALWAADDGAFVTVRGEHFTAEDVRIYDRPDQPVPLVVAVSGAASLDLAASCGAEGIMATDPDPALVDGWAERGGDRAATWTEIPFAVAATEAEGLALAHERFRFGAPGWKVMAELPNPVNFDAATASVREEDLAGSVPHGPDPKRYVEATRAYVDAGFDKISFVPVGDDLDAFFAVVDAVRDELG
jgi:G6PDH family F420-dependent oxidoreductase